VEVKTRKRNDPRTERQIADGKKTLEYIRTDRANDLFGMKGEIRRISLATPEVHYREQLNQVIAHAMKDGVGLQEVEQGFFYVAVTDFGRDPSSYMPIQPNQSNYIVVPLGDFRYDHSDYYPFTLSIHDPLALYEFYAGDLVLMVLLNIRCQHIVHKPCSQDIV
jgi:hypothetical protein